MSDKVLALVRYYAREGYARQVQTVCSEVLRKRANDPLLVFWRAVGMLMEGNTAEALRELAAVSQVPDLELAAAAAMVTAHEAAKVPDQDAIMQLSTRVEVEQTTASDAAALHLASFYSLVGSNERARGLVERVLSSPQDGTQAQVLLGWIILGQHQAEQAAGGGMMDDSELEEADAHLQAALQVDPHDLEALLGRAKLLQRRKELSAALDILTEVVVRFSWFLPAMVEKAGVLLALGDWEQVNEMVAKILGADPHNIMAIAWQALHALTREGDNKSAVKLLQDLFGAINRVEPRHAGLYYDMARCFGRLAGADTSLLTVTCMMAERAVQLKPEHAPYMVESGYQKLFLGEYAVAAERFGAAQAVDELSLDASSGLLEASILQGELEEAQGGLLFLQEMHVSQASLQMGGAAVEVEPPTLRYLKGLLAWRLGSASKQGPAGAQDASASDYVQEGLAGLEGAIVAHIEAAAQIPPSLEMYQVLWPGRITGIVRMLLAAVGGEPRGPTEAPSPLIAKCNRALQLLSKHVPALLESRVLSVRALFLGGLLDEALRRAHDLLRSNPDDITMHLLVCNVYVHQEKLAAAQAALEQAVSANFGVRETPLYHIISAKLHLADGKLDEARKVLEAAMALPGVRSALTPQQRARLTRRSAEPTLHERASIYLLLAQTLSRLSKLPDAPEAKKYIQDAIREFEGTSEEVRVTIADSEMAIAREDVDGALKKLRKIPSSSAHYMKARMAMADIFLKHRNDKARYIKCYMDLVEQNNDYDSCCMLGEAFMQIQEPEKAVHAFQAALVFNPKDADLMARVSRALVTTHEYKQAIDYYNKAIYSARQNYWLLLELAKLLIRLRQWKQAQDALNRCLERPDAGSGGVEGRAIDVEAWQCMSKVYKGNHDVENYLECLLRALELQKQMVIMLRGELPDTIQSAKNLAAGICYEIAEHYKMDRKFDKAMEMYNEALKNSDTHTPSLLALAKMHLADGNLDGCQQQCVLLLKQKPDDEEAAIMLAELMFHKEHYDSSIYHFQQLMEKQPCHWRALSQLINLLRRAGKLDDVNKYFSAAEAASPSCVMDAGWHYCKGLAARFAGDPREAVRCFNLARKDGKWGTQATLHMVEIYLNPDNDAVWEEKENENTLESREALATAQSLLAQVRHQDTLDQRFRVLHCYAAMATRDPGQVEAALNLLLDLGNQDPNNVPVLLAMATGFMILKQTPKARNQLKRVQKIPYKPEEGEEFERAWLLLTDIHIQGGKFDLAQDLCQKCLKYNKSCAKAWEYLGSIMEREQSYKDAADHYEKAWRHASYSSPAIGYKLGFNYLKAKRYVEAIDVCHKVLKAYPDYPKIRKDILDKARQNLKP